MRVRPAGQSSSLAASGSLGGCDANTSKAISEDVPSPSIDCEAHSAAGNLHIPGSYFLFLSLSFALPKIAILNMRKILLLIFNFFNFFIPLFFCS